MIGHTPGPWEVKGKSVRTVQHTAEGSAPNGYQGGICNCFGRRMGPRSAIDDVAEANARLIAASPDLLEALEGILPYLEEDPDDEEYSELVRAVHAAVTKARG